MRGALTLVLALAVTRNEALPDNIHRFVAVLATGFVLFTLSVNGTTLRSSFGRWVWTACERAIRRGLTLNFSTAEAREAAHQIAQTHALSASSRSSE